MSRRLIPWLALAVAFVVTTPATADSLPDPGSGFIRVEGRHFVEPGGRPVLLKGINLGNWLVPEGYMFEFDRARSPREIETVVERLLGTAGAAAFWSAFRDNYVAEDDVRFIAAAGFNLVRVPLHYALFVDPDDPDRFEGPGYRLLDRLIEWCRHAGLRVLLDLHAAPGGQTGVNHDDGTGYPLVFYLPRERALTIRLWQHLAARYRNEPAVLGYDLLNEPISPYLDTDYLNPKLEPLYRDMVRAIRAVDRNHVIFLAAAQWSTNFAVFGPPFAHDLAYTYHKFWSDTRIDAIQDYVNFANRYNVPVFLGESGETTDAKIAAFRRLNEEHGIGWCYWTYKNLASTSTVVSIPRPAAWGTIVAVANRPPDQWSPDNVPARAEAAQILGTYLEAIKFKNDRINRGYLAALGLHPARP